ncbi:MAG: hypothetical protein KC458_07875, partial [Dehalococcoidia bacterium]|nr:hypothetical protein [Dehalococcoidia bacterium]
MDRKDFLKVIGWSTGGATLWLLGCRGGEDIARATSTSSATSSPASGGTTTAGASTTAADASSTTATATATTVGTEVARELPVINGYVNQVSIVEQ